jgi:hypothetical protein
LPPSVEESEPDPLVEELGEALEPLEEPVPTHVDVVPGVPVDVPPFVDPPFVPPFVVEPPFVPPFVVEPPFVPPFVVVPPVVGHGTHVWPFVPVPLTSSEPPLVVELSEPPVVVELSDPPLVLESSEPLVLESPEPLVVESSVPVDDESSVPLEPIDGETLGQSTQLVAELEPVEVPPLVEEPVAPLESVRPEPIPVAPDRPDTPDAPAVPPLPVEAVPEGHAVPVTGPRTNGPVELVA